MGTREVYEEKLRTGSMYHEPTIKPGLSTPRCLRCLSLLNFDSRVTSVIYRFTPINLLFWHIPPSLMFSASSAALGGYGLPNFTQFSVTSYYAASRASHYGISLITRYIEATYITRSRQQKLR